MATEIHQDPLFGDEDYYYHDDCMTIGIVNVVLITDYKSCFNIDHEYNLFIDHV